MPVYQVSRFRSYWVEEEIQIRADTPELALAEFSIRCKPVRSDNGRPVGWVDVTKPKAIELADSALQAFEIIEQNQKKEAYDHHQP